MHSPHAPEQHQSLMPLLKCVRKTTIRSMVSRMDYYCIAFQDLGQNLDLTEVEALALHHLVQHQDYAFPFHI